VSCATGILLLAALVTARALVSVPVRGWLEKKVQDSVIGQ